MFLKTNLLKKLLEGAYKTGGITVGQIEEEYFIEGTWWMLKIEKGEFPKEEKGALIMLTGEMPEEGQVFQSRKDCGNQYEITRKGMWDLELKQATELVITNLTYDLKREKVRILQEIDTKKCVLINDKIIEALDYFKDADTVEGPYSKSGSPFIFWENSSMTFLVGKIESTSEEMKKYLELLENIEFEEYM